MKKVMFFAMACMLCLVSCNNSEVKRVKISESKGLYSVTTKHNGLLMTGVFKEDGTAVIEALPDARFVVKDDSVYIVGFLEGDKRCYYTMSGQVIASGKISYFRRLKDVSTVIYSGIDSISNKTVFFFPQTEEVILANKKFIDRANSILGYQRDDGFVIKSLKDNKEYLVPAIEPAYYVRCNGDPVKIVIARKKTATIYDLTGNPIKEIPIRQWDQARKKGKVELDFPNALCIISLKKSL